MAESAKGTIDGPGGPGRVRVQDPDCGFRVDADGNAARNILHLYRKGHAITPAAGRAAVGRARRVEPATAG